MEVSSFLLLRSSTENPQLQPTGAPQPEEGNRVHNWIKGANHNNRETHIFFRLHKPVKPQPKIFELFQQRLKMLSKLRTKPDFDDGLLEQIFTGLVHSN